MEATQDLRVVDPEMLSAQGGLPGIIALLGQLGTGALITEEGIGQLFDRHPDSVKRAVERGELPPPVRMFGQPTWTVGALLDHINNRLSEAAADAERNRKRLAKL
jgi:hypothetical protein